MIIGKVVGHVVSTRKNENLIGQKLLIVEPLENLMGNMGSSRFIAIDNVGAGVGERVLVALGSSARRMVGDDRIPTDAAIVGIIDEDCEF